MFRKLLPFLVLLYGVGWAQTDNCFILIPPSLASPDLLALYHLPLIDWYLDNQPATNFILGLTVMRLMFHIALLLLLFNDRQFRAYSFFGVCVCLVYIFSGGNDNVIFLHSPYWANVLFFITISFLPVSLTYYVGTLNNVPTHFRKLVPMGWFVGLVCGLNLVDNLFFSHAYLGQAFISFFALLLVGLMIFSIVSYSRGIRPSIWYLIPLLIYLPPYALFYARNAYLHGQTGSFVGGALQENSIRAAFLIEFLFVPFLMAIMLRQAYRDKTATRRSLENKESEQMQTLALDQLKTRFFTNISHEFRTPLTLLLGPLDDLRQRFPTDTLYSSMYRNAQRLLTLINQLLDLARLDAGQLKLNLQPGDIAADLRVWVTSFESMAQSRGISLTLEQNELVWHVFYDADKIEKITTNLVANALKFTNRGGQVNIEADYEPNGVTLRIIDTGVGIPPENLPTIFDRFYQRSADAGSVHTADPAKKNNPVNALYEGSGVGLALVRELVDLMAGSIGVASLVGEGTTFTVWIPMESQADPTMKTSMESVSVELPKSPFTSSGNIMPESREAIGKQASDDNRPTLLVVEDNDDLRDYIRSLLATTYFIREATNGHQGLEMAREWLPDLILTDLMMPRLDGLQLCRQLRQDVRTDHIPVVMLTAKAGIEDRLQGFGTGIDDYLTKPFAPMELQIRLKNLHHRQQVIRASLQHQLTATTKPGEPTKTPRQDNQSIHHQTFMELIYALIDRQIDNVHLTVETMADEMAMSSRTLNRKLKALVGMSAGEVIRTHRLRRAADLLREGLSPTETAYRVGFENPSNFSRAFREHFQNSPSAFAEEN